MPYFAFNPELVQLFNNATYEQDWCESTWQRYQTEAERELSIHGQYFLSDSEQLHHAELKSILSTLPNDPPDDLPQLLSFVKETANFIQNLGVFRQGRVSLKFTKISEMDQLLSASVATVQGRGNIPYLATLASPAFEKVGMLAKLFEETKDELPVEAQKAIVHGLTAAKVGFTSLNQAIAQTDLERLENAVINLKSGAELLEHLVRWDEQWREANSFQFPCGGFESAKLIRNGDIEGFRSGPLESLRVFWETTSEMMILAEQDLVLLERVDQTISQLYEADQEQALALCQELESLFVQIEGKALSPGTKENPWNRLAQFLAIAVVSGVPDLLVLDTGASLRDSSKPELQKIGQLIGKEVEAEKCQDALSYMLKTSAPPDLLLTNS